MWTGTPGSIPEGWPCVCGARRYQTHAPSVATDAPPMWYAVQQDVVAAHQALDRLGAPTTKTVTMRSGEGTQIITIGLAERILAVFSRLTDEELEQLSMGCSLLSGLPYVPASAKQGWQALAAKLRGMK
jgi:hypothetical protein